jgi:hypothetical protein
MTRKKYRYGRSLHQADLALRSQLFFLYKGLKQIADDSWAMLGTQWGMDAFYHQNISSHASDMERKAGTAERLLADENWDSRTREKAESFIQKNKSLLTRKNPRKTSKPLNYTRWSDDALLHAYAGYGGDKKAALKELRGRGRTEPELNAMIADWNRWMKEESVSRNPRRARKNTGPLFSSDDDLHDIISGEGVFSDIGVLKELKRRGWTDKDLIKVISGSSRDAEGIVAWYYSALKNPRRARKNTGYVASKIRANTARRNTARRNSNTYSTLVKTMGFPPKDAFPQTFVGRAGEWQLVSSGDESTDDPGPWAHYVAPVRSHYDDIMIEQLGPRYIVVSFYDSDEGERHDGGAQVYRSVGNALQAVTSGKWFLDLPEELW